MEQLVSLIIQLFYLLVGWSKDTFGYVVALIFYTCLLVAITLAASSDTDAAKRFAIAAILSFIVLVIWGRYKRKHDKNQKG